MVLSMGTGVRTMETYTVIPAKRPDGRVSPVLPEPVPALDEPTRRQLPAEPNGRVAAAWMERPRNPG
jgi:hypothetical protein